MSTSKHKTLTLFDEHIQLTKVKEDNNNEINQINTQESLGQQNNKASCCDFLNSRTFIFRLIVICITTFLLILCVSYSCAQLLSLQLSDYWCKETTLAQIRDNSIKHGLPHGDGESCWKIKDKSVDYDLLWSTKSYGYQLQFNAARIAQFILFVILSLIYLIFLCIDIKLVCQDIICHQKLSLGTDKNNNRSINSSKPSDSQESNGCCKRLMTNCCSIVKTSHAWYKQKFQTDTVGWCTKWIVKEFVEICIQTQAMLVYNGYGDKGDNLALEAKYIIIFSVFLCINSVITGMLWLCYVFKPKLCYGLTFEILLNANDIIVDIFYAAFPFIIFVSYDNSNVLTGLASLETDSVTTFIAAFFPMVFLLEQCYTLSKRSKIAMREFYGKIDDGPGQQHPSEKNKKCCHIFILINGILFICYGIIQIVYVSNHFNSATLYCSSVINDMGQYYKTTEYNINETIKIEYIEPVAELLVWNSCNRKVYPFDFVHVGKQKDVCQCRQFRQPKFESDLFVISDRNILSNVFRKWYMLEKIEWNFEKYQTNQFNFTSDMFTAKQMRVVKLKKLNIGEINSGISNWKKIEYLQMWRMVNVPTLPNTMKQLKDIQLLDIWPFVSKFPDWICSLTKLRRLVLNNNIYANATTLPRCVSNLQNLEALSVSAWTALENIPLDLFVSMPKLIDLNIAYTRINIDSLLEYNHLSGINELDFQFKWNKNADYWCYSSALCSDYSRSPILSEFITTSQCCVNQCKNVLHSTQCTAKDWQDGVCDTGCDSNECSYDGGDCLQLCDFSKCNYTLLGNGICNQECNHTTCDYDKYDCLKPQTQCELTYEKHNCNLHWINDGWCDSNCMYLSECGFDGKDCINGCSGICASQYGIFEFVDTNNDNHISIREIQKSCALAQKGYPHLNITNCTDLVFAWDKNNDSMVSYYEGLIGLHHVLNISFKKAIQLNCSACVGSIEQYYN
eukprot:18574_1